MPAARRARKKITPQLTAMIPISRRTIARAMACWFGGGERLEVEVAQLALGGAGAGALGDEGDDQRQDPVEVVEVVGRLVAGEDQQAAEHRLQEDRGLGGAQQIPEGNGGPVPEPGDAADRAGDQVEEDQRAADDEMDPGHLYPPKRVGIPLADAENHYVASCHKVGV